jgi:hypothetical protein
MGCDAVTLGVVPDLAKDQGTLISGGHAVLEEGIMIP